MSEKEQLSREQQERRDFLETTKKVGLGVAATAPAATLLLAASTQMAMPYNNGNDKPVGNAPPNDNPKHGSGDPSPLH